MSNEFLRGLVVCNELNGLKKRNKAKGGLRYCNIG